MSLFCPQTSQENILINMKNSLLELSVNLPIHLPEETQQRPHVSEDPVGGWVEKPFRKTTLEAMHRLKRCTDGKNRAM